MQINMCRISAAPTKLLWSKSINLKAIEVPRWVKYSKKSYGFNTIRQSMQEVIWKKISKNIKVHTNCKIEKISKNHNSVTLHSKNTNKTFKIYK